MALRFFSSQLQSSFTSHAAMKLRLCMASI